MRRALLIAPSFFGYYRDIATELEKHGYQVDYACDRPRNTVLFKSIGRIDYRLVERKIGSHVEELVKLLRKQQYDLLLFVGGMSIWFTRSQVLSMRRATSAKLILYLWDSLRNCQCVGEYLDLFDRVFSFEPDDCDASVIHFLPLFFTGGCNRGFDKSIYVDSYDACFVGSVHQVEKFNNVTTIVDRMRTLGARVFTHYYMPSHSVSLLRKAQYSRYRKEHLEYYPLDRSAVCLLTEQSRIIIDSPQKGQKGLSMRAIEAIGANRKLITTNSGIIEYDFYRFGNVLVCDVADSIDEAFVFSDPTPLPNDIRDNYSIASWADTLLKA